MFKAREEEVRERTYDQLLTALSFLSHETRNLIAPIKLAVGTKDISDTQACLDNVNMISKLMKNVLLMGQLSANKHVFERREVVLDVFLDKLEETGRGWMAAPVEFRCSRQGTEGVAVVLPQADIAWCISRILQNAGHFTDEGNVSMTTTLSPLPHGKAILEFNVTDTGCGMSDSLVLRAMTPFGLIRTACTSPRARAAELVLPDDDGHEEGEHDPIHGNTNGGCGLCFPIAKAIAEQNGGQLEVASTLGEGTTVRWWLEVQHVHAGPTLPRRDKRVRKGRPGLGGTRQRILAVDDNAVIRKMYAHWGKRHKHDVTLAENGAEAVALAEKDSLDRFTVILMDKEMGVMDGLEAAKAIRKLGFKGVIALVSGSILSDTVKQDLDGVFNHFFAKGDTPSWESLFRWKKRR